MASRKEELIEIEKNFLLFHESTKTLLINARPWDVEEREDDDGNKERIVSVNYEVSRRTVKLIADDLRAEGVPDEYGHLEDFVRVSVQGFMMGLRHGADLAGGKCE